MKAPEGAPGLNPDPESAPTVPPRARALYSKPRPKSFHLSPIPTPDEQRTVNGIVQLFQNARSHRNALLPRWNECYRMLTNRQWDMAKRAAWLPSPQIPEIFPIIRTLVAWQMDMKFRTAVSPAAVPNTDLANYLLTIAQDLEYALNASWQANTEEREWGMIAWDGLVYGTGFAKTCWENDLAGGLGDAKTRHVSPFCLYPDPNATSLDDMLYMVEARNMSLQELDYRYPGAAAAFSTSSGITYEVDEPPSILDMLGTRPKSQFGNPAALPPATGVGQWNRPTTNPHYPSVDMPRITVLECWLKEHTYSDVTDIHTKQTVRRAHASWRVVVVANNRVLMDESAEAIWTHGGHPYSRYQPIDFNAEFWGISLVELLISPQKCLNRILAAIQHNVELSGNPLWLDQSVSGRQQNINNKPGQRIQIDISDQRTGWQPPPPINAAAQQLVDFLLKRMEAISGMTALLKGTAPGGRPSGGVVDQMAEASHVGVRAMLRQIEYALADAFRKKAALVVENYTAPRMVSIAGSEGANSFRALKSRHFLVPGTDGSVPIQYQLIVDAGSRHHVSRQMRENRAVQLFAMELIDELAALTEMDFPNAVQVAQRVQARKAEMAAAEAAAKGGGSMGPGQRTAARV